MTRMRAPSRSQTPLTTTGDNTTAGQVIPAMLRGHHGLPLAEGTARCATCSKRLTCADRLTQGYGCRGSAPRRYSGRSHSDGPPPRTDGRSQGHQLLTLANAPLLRRTCAWFYGGERSAPPVFRWRWCDSEGRRSVWRRQNSGWPTMTGPKSSGLGK